MKSYVIPAADTVSAAYPPGQSPLPTPDGWFCLGLSIEVRPGTVVTRRLAGEDVVLYRTGSGLLRATRPYCPHLGAHLGQGGRVAGEDIVCPFHGFAFGTDGLCTRTGYGTRPPRARLAMLPVRERYGLILVWHHHAGEPSGWEIPELPSDGYSRLVQSVTEFAGHPQEVLENAFDTGHVTTLHGGIVTSGSAHSAHYEGPACGVTVRVGIRVPVVGVSWTQDYLIGLSGIGYSLTHIELPRGITIRVWGLPTPVGPWRIQLRLVTSARVPGPRWWRAVVAPLVARLSLWINATRFVLPEKGGDLPVWNTKRYLAHPALADGDGPLMRYRRWADQFYPVEVPRSVAA